MKFQVIDEETYKAVHQKCKTMSPAAIALEYLINDAALHDNLEEAEKMIKEMRDAPTYDDYCALFAVNV